MLACLFKTGIVLGFLHFPRLSAVWQGVPEQVERQSRSETNLSIQARKEQGNGFPLVIMDILVTVSRRTQIPNLITTTQIPSLICRKTEGKHNCGMNLCTEDYFDKYKHIFETQC